MRRGIVIVIWIKGKPLNLLYLRRVVLNWQDLVVGWCWRKGRMHANGPLLAAGTVCAGAGGLWQQVMTVSLLRISLWAMYPESLHKIPYNPD